MITIDQATEAVSNFELMQYFNTISEGGRTKIAEELVAMVNWPRERVLRNGYGEAIAYVEPIDRLKWLLKQCKRVSEWPGMAQIRALYCLRFKPADGVEMEYCTIPGYTLDELESGTDFLSLDRGKQPEQKYIPAPDDEPIGDDLMKQIARVAEAKRQ
jgi:hypothetical protein